MAKESNAVSVKTVSKKIVKPARNSTKLVVSKITTPTESKAVKVLKSTTAKPNPVLDAIAKKVIDAALDRKKKKKKKVAETEETVDSEITAPVETEKVIEAITDPLTKPVVHKQLNSDKGVLDVGDSVSTAWGLGCRYFYGFIMDYQIRICRFDGKIPSYFNR